MLAISPRLAPMHRLQRTQNTKPYRKATEPPEGITIPRLPARQIHVLKREKSTCQHWSSGLFGVKRADDAWGCTYLRIAKLIPTIVSFDNRGFKCPVPDPFAKGSMGSE